MTSQKKGIYKIVSSFLFIFTFFILIKKYSDYIDKENYTKLILILIICVNFFFGAIFKNFYKKSLIFFIYFIIIIYSTNALFVYYDIQNFPEKRLQKKFKELNIKYDKRKLLDVVNEERIKNINIYPYVVPREFLDKNTSKNLILTPMPNTNYIACNEYGNWKIFKTDELGFNNKSFLLKFDTLLMGDSFAEGSCVESDSEPVNILKKMNTSAYTIGVSGNGILLSLALAHEIKSKVEFNKIVWLIYDNDFYDILIEQKSKELIKYIDHDYEGNMYFNNIAEIATYQKKFINNNLKSFKKKYSIKESLIELKPIINRLNSLIFSRKETNYYKQKNIFEKIFLKIQKIYPEKEIFIVYLPESSCFHIRVNDCEIRAEILKNTNSDIKFLNYFDFVRKNIIDYKSLYALNQENVHFSPAGYEFLVKFISKEIK